MHVICRLVAHVSGTRHMPDTDKKARDWIGGRVTENVFRQLANIDGEGVHSCWDLCTV